MSSPAALHPTRTQAGVESTLLFATLACVIFLVVTWAYVCRKAPLLREGKARPRARWTNPTTMHVLPKPDDDETEGTATGSGGSVGSSDEEDEEMSSIS